MNATSFDLKDSIFQHLELTLVSLVAAVILGVVCGILLYRSKSANKFISVISAIQTIPTLAMLGFLVPFLGIGTKPALFVLILYGFYPILINTYSGLTQVDPEYVEISDALGMNRRQQLFKVRLPLSIPVIMAGVRTGFVSIIGLATLTSLIGSGGLGDFIYRGINTMNNELILLGTIPVTIIVLLMSFLLKRVEVHWKFFYRRKKAVALIMVLVCLVYCIVPAIGKTKDKTIVLASKDFTESGLFTTIIAELIEEKTDITVEKKMYLGTTDILHKGLVNGDIDGYVEYTGTAYLTVFNETEPREDMKEWVEQAYADIGITAMPSLGVNNTFVIITRQDIKDEYKIENISDLENYHNQFTLTAYAEFIDREDCLPNLVATYDLMFKDVKQMDRSLGYKALAEGEVDFMASFSTEPAIFKYSFKEVSDDKGLFMRYDAIPLFSTETLEKYPEIIPLIESLEERLDNETMARLNSEVENDGRKEVEVAREWLQSEGFID